MMQQYLIPLKEVPPPGVELIGSLVFFDAEGTQVIGFVSEQLPDECAEMTMFIPVDLPVTEGMTDIKESLTSDEIGAKLRFAMGKNSDFKKFIEEYILGIYEL